MIAIESMTAQRTCSYCIKLSGVEVIFPLSCNLFFIFMYALMKCRFAYLVIYDEYEKEKVKKKKSGLFFVKVVLSVSCLALTL